MLPRCFPGSVDGSDARADRNDGGEIHDGVRTRHAAGAARARWAWPPCPHRERLPSRGAAVNKTAYTADGVVLLPFRARLSAQPARAGRGVRREPAYDTADAAGPAAEHVDEPGVRTSGKD